MRSVTSPTASGRGTPVHSARRSEDGKPIFIEKKDMKEEKTIPIPEKKQQKVEEQPSSDTHTLDLPGVRAPSSLRKIPSTVSLSATRPPSPSLKTPITPSLTTGTNTTTDDEDTDFQSAYSASPRGSYGEFDNYAAKDYERSGSESESGTPTAMDKDHLNDFGRTSRDRAASNATAKVTPAKSLLRASQDTVISQSRNSNH